MINIRRTGIASSINTFWVSPPIRSINRDWNRTFSVKGFNQLIVRICRNICVSCKNCSCRSFSGIESARSVLLFIRILTFSRQTSFFNNAFVSQLTNTTFASTSSSTMLWVISATSNLLFWEIQQLSIMYGPMRFNWFSSWKRPAWAAAALILWRCENGRLMVSPIKVFGNGNSLQLVNLATVAFKSEWLPEALMVSF